MLSKDILYNHIKIHDSIELSIRSKEHLIGTHGFMFFISSVLTEKVDYTLFDSSVLSMLKSDNCTVDTLASYINLVTKTVTNEVDTNVDDFTDDELFYLFGDNVIYESCWCSRGLYGNDVAALESYILLGRYITFNSNYTDVAFDLFDTFKSKGVSSKEYFQRIYMLIRKNSHKDIIYGLAKELQEDVGNFIKTHTTCNMYSYSISMLPSKLESQDLSAIYYSYAEVVGRLGAIIVLLSIMYDTQYIKYYADNNFIVSQDSIISNNFSIYSDLHLSLTSKPIDYDNVRKSVKEFLNHTYNKCNGLLFYNLIECYVKEYMNIVECDSYDEALNTLLSFGVDILPTEALIYKSKMLIEHSLLLNM